MNTAPGPTPQLKAVSMVSRRHLLQIAAALPVPGVFCCLLRSSVASAQAVAPPTRKIDVHHHIMPPRYLAATRDLQVPIARAWTPEKSIADMDQAGVAAAITSISQPGVWLGSTAQGRHLARLCNDYAARLRIDYPKRFGMFACIPLPDTEGSLREIEYGLDVLKANGISLLTSYRNRWLGDPVFDPVLQELNRRKVVVFTHPTSPACCHGLSPGLIDDTVIEFGTDTTRAIASLMFRGAVERYPDIRWIFSHGGGSAPYLVERLTRVGASAPIAGRLPHGTLSALRHFYYDIAQIAAPPPMAALTRLADPTRILWGSDFPFRKGEDYNRQLPDCSLDPDAMRRIERDNAAALFPELEVLQGSPT
jgi:predicted TIM-barrel fold metal-dependent hydrolase